MGGLLKGPDSSLDIHIVVVARRVWSRLLLLLRRRSGVGKHVAEARSSRRHALYLSTMTFWTLPIPGIIIIAYPAVQLSCYRHIPPVPTQHMARRASA